MPLHLRDKPTVFLVLPGAEINSTLGLLFSLFWVVKPCAILSFFLFYIYFVDVCFLSTNKYYSLCFKICQ